MQKCHHNFYILCREVKYESKTLYDPNPKHHSLDYSKGYLYLNT